MERICFSNSTYSKEGGSAFGRKIKTAFLMPMNANEQQAKEHNYNVLFDRIRNYWTNIFGNCGIFPVFNTMQVDDYSKYDMSFFDTDEKLDCIMKFSLKNCRKLMN